MAQQRIDPHTKPVNPCSSPEPMDKTYESVNSDYFHFPGGSDGKASVYNVGDPGSIPGSGRSPGEGNGNPLQYSCLENPKDRRAWWATVHGLHKARHDQGDSMHA